MVNSARIWCAVAVTCLGCASSAAAQTIRGTVRETDGGPLISGAFVSLLNSSGQAVRADFTTVEGAFSFATPGPGEYRLRVERIGYATWLTVPYALTTGQILPVTVEVPPRPIRLRDLRVEVSGACYDDPSQGHALATAWEELRKALETAVWAERRGELRFTFTRWERILEPRTLAVREATSRMYRHRPLPPFESVPADQLVESGFVVQVADSSEYRALDANVLLSQEFRAAHCFGLQRATVGGVPRLGITFRPRERRQVVQIEGTLWLDEESAELDRVQLSYRNLPVARGVDRRLIGAEVVFDRLPDGPFYVTDWWIRFPFHEDGSFTGYKQGGGAVKRAAAGDLSWEMGHGVAVGIVRDSVSRDPLPGADVILRNWEDAAAFLPPPDPADTPFSTMTDDEGRFVVGGLQDGVYALRVDHPKFRAAGVRLNETRVVIEERIVVEREAWTPSAETLYARVCPGSSLSEGVGAVVGIARDSAAGVPVPGVEIEAQWSVRLGRGAARGVYASAVSDDEGRFAICGFPLDGPVRLRPLGTGTPHAVQFEPDARVVWQDVSVAPGSSADPVPDQSVDGRRDFR